MIYILIILIITLVSIYICKKDNVKEKFVENEKDPKIYIINMKKDTERLKNFGKSLKKHNLKFERIEAINGKELSEKQIKEKTTWFCNKFCTKTQIGCFLSHSKAWETLAKSNNEGAIIMEDDVILLENFKEKSKIYINYYNSNSEIDILLFNCNV